MRLFLGLLIMIHVSSYADLDADQAKALKETQALLRNSADRDKAIANDPKAKDTDAKVNALAGSSENKEDMYELSAQLMEKIVQKTNGDSEKMQALMLKAQKDPKAFYEEFFDENQKNKVRSVANKIEKDKPGIGGQK